MDNLLLLYPIPIRRQPQSKDVPREHRGSVRYTQTRVLFKSVMPCGNIASKDTTTNLFPRLSIYHSSHEDLYQVHL